MTFKRLVWATTALTGGLLLATAASAQSTGTQTQEADSTEVSEVVVTASRGLPTIEGTIVAETAPKSRSTVTQEFISTQTPGQSIIQSLNLIPGVSFTNSDAYGSSGGNLRLRSFDGNRVSLTFDGIPLNDTGNYAIYTNQQLDPELIERAVVNLGTTDVDSPTASATGGTINYVTLRPTADMGAMLQGSVGSDDYYRVFGMFNTGAFPGMFEDFSSWVAGSYTRYDKFKGPGELEKWQVNGRMFWDLGDGDFVSLAAHYNENRNAFYRNVSLAQLAFYGRDFDNLPTCTRDAPTAGVADNDGSTPFGTGGGTFLTANDNPANPGSCTNYYGLRINPSDTGNVRGQFRYSLADNLTFTFDPYYQYTLANGGGTTVVAENDLRLRGAGAPIPGIDLNGDGDVLDQVRLYTPNITNTNRIGFTSSLIYDINDNHRIRLALTYDHGRHRQTGEYTFLDASGDPLNVFGGKPDGGGPAIVGFDGNNIQGRNRYSIAELAQLSFEYRGQFLDDKVTLAVGLRAPQFSRELNQYCFSQRGSSNVLCTTETPILQGSGYFRFAGRGATDYVAPYSADLQYTALLPNVGVSWKIFDNHVVYVSYAEGLSAPRTDNLYTVSLDASGEVAVTGADPERTRAYDLGWRYQGDRFIANAAIWYNLYNNRIVSSFDDTLGYFVDRNIGTVQLWGFDGQAGWEVTENLSLYVSAAYTETELQNNIALSATTFLPTKGKELVETPDWTFGFRAFYDTEWFSVGGQVKYTGERWSTDVNDEKTDAYTVVDLDARFKLDNWGWEGSYVQFNVTNLFDEFYLANISSTNNATVIDVDPGPGVVNRNPSAPLYSVGAPRTFMVTLRGRF